VQCSKIDRIFAYSIILNISQIVSFNYAMSEISTNVHEIDVRVPVRLLNHRIGEVKVFLGVYQ